MGAIGISVLLHGLLAAGLVAYLEWGPQPDVLATLDLSSVELSFAEKEVETAAVAPLPPSVAAARPEVRPKHDDEPPEAKLPTPAAPEPRELRLREPSEDVRMEDAKDEKDKEEAKDEKEVREERRETREEQAVAPRQARIEAPPRAKRNIRPEYPKGARQRGEQGEVVVEIRVNERGGVDDVKVAVTSGFAELDEAAVRAAKAAKFSPARSGREAVASTARLKLQFKLK